MNVSCLPIPLNDNSINWHFHPVIQRLIERLIKVFTYNKSYSQTFDKDGAVLALIVALIPGHRTHY